MVESASLFKLGASLNLLCCIIYFLLNAYQTDLSRLKRAGTDTFRNLSFIKGETKRFPQAIIVGARKCGTRALIEFINIHPMVRVCHSEPHFFDKNKTYSKDFGWYLDQMPPSFPDQITIEKTPSYIRTPFVPARIHEMNPRVKLILVVREPVSRAVSDYYHIRLVTNTTLPPFEELAVSNITGEVDENWDLINRGKYAFQFASWLQYFSRDQILVLSGERLIADPKVEVEKLELFLGLEPLIEEDHFETDKTRGFSCFKSFDKKTKRCLGKSKGVPHAAIDSKILLKLKRFYEPLNNEFYSLVQEDFGWNK